MSYKFLACLTDLKRIQILSLRCYDCFKLLALLYPCGTQYESSSVLSLLHQCLCYGRYALLYLISFHPFLYCLQSLNAYHGLAALGEALNDPVLQATGQITLATEIRSVREYFHVRENNRQVTWHHCKVTWHDTRSHSINTGLHDVMKRLYGITTRLCDISTITWHDKKHQDTSYMVSLQGQVTSQRGHITAARQYNVTTSQHNIMEHVVSKFCIRLWLTLTQYTYWAHLMYSHCAVNLKVSTYIVLVLNIFFYEG